MLDANWAVSMKLTEISGNVYNYLIQMSNKLQQMTNTFVRNILNIRYIFIITLKVLGGFKV